MYFCSPRDLISLLVCFAFLFCACYAIPAPILPNPARETLETWKPRTKKEVKKFKSMGLYLYTIKQQKFISREHF